jgi:FkbM family methyltransferase
VSATTGAFTLTNGATPGRSDRGTASESCADRPATAPPIERSRSKEDFIANSRLIAVATKFRFAFKDKAAFYWSYFASKVFRLWFEVKRPRLRMFLYEMLYSSAKLLKPTSLLPSPFRVDFVETVFGKFKVRPGTVDMANASPAFERKDLDYLLNLIGELRGRAKKVLFLDIGADIGTFSVTVGNRFKPSGIVKAMAFEPAPTSFDILEENIRLNGLEGVTDLCNFALYDRDGLELDFSFNVDAPGSSGIRTGQADVIGHTGQKVRTRTLDSVLKDGLADYGAVVFKMDVEGVEREVLEGSRRVIQTARDSGIEIYLVVEDFIKPSIVAYLEGSGAEFLAKLTPYNSWWRYGTTT